MVDVPTRTVSDEFSKSCVVKSEGGDVDRNSCGNMRSHLGTRIDLNAWETVSPHNSNSHNFKLRVSNPIPKHIAKP